MRKTPARKAVRKKAAPAPKDSKRVYGGASPEERRRERRERLMAAGLDLFARQGYQRTSIEQLCAAARVTPRSFYEAFQDREELLMAIYEAVIDECKGAAVQTLQRPGLDLQERVSVALTAFIELYLGDWRRAQIAVLEVVGVSATFERRRREVIRQFATVFEAYANVLAAEGLLEPRDYGPLSLALVGGINELFADWLIKRERPELSAITKTIVEVLEILRAGTATAVAPAKTRQSSPS